MREGKLYEAKVSKKEAAVRTDGCITYLQMQCVYEPALLLFSSMMEIFVGPFSWIQFH